MVIAYLLSLSCNHSYTPKPRGYLRIDFPEKKYRLLDSIFPYTFEYPVYSIITPGVAGKKEPYWINIATPSYRCIIHLSYKKVTNNLSQYTEDAYELAYKHAIKATSIDPALYSKPEKHVYGILYNIKGNVASSVQFYMTDSVKNFIRGSLYFYSPPNADSLAPEIDFFKKDIIHLIETLEWKEKK